MKQSRRQELKTNVLSVKLQQLYDSALKNLNYILAIVVAVVLVLAVTLYHNHTNQAFRTAGWDRYYEIMSNQGQADSEKLIADAGDLASDYNDDAVLGPRTMELQADLAYESAMRLSSIKEQDKRLELFASAKKAYQALLDTHADRPGIETRARMGLAAVEENLIAAGKGDINTARQQYEKVLAGPSSPAQAIATELLKTLDDRLQKLEIVATRPAEVATTAPAAAQATASAPAAAPAKAPATATTTAPK